ncbi:16S rRNA (guanine(527)-N(7))-methyltransferase RsmG [Thiorhodococcus fuscus]|uniref:Ribosomal RNA small subunit methyltransferase G n=1 Tax=Thiorhodococcus fuscus TaxID=527200 RepID=A0ABW4Y6C7_9GAMM
MNIPLDPLGASERSGIEDRLAQGCEALGLACRPEQRQRLTALISLLVRWNKAYNLTAVRDPLEMVSKHLLDSLAVLPFLFGDSVLDLGTGAGLPGLPLAIMAPKRRFWLLDSNNKKVRFVRQAVLDLGLDNVEPVQARIETYRPEQKFSTIVSRAVAADEILSGSNAELLAYPGRLLLMKGRQPDERIETTGLPSAVVMIHRLSVPFLDVSRHLIEIRST